MTQTCLYKVHITRKLLIFVFCKSLNSARNDKMLTIFPYNTPNHQRKRKIKKSSDFLHDQSQEVILKRRCYVFRSSVLNKLQNFAIIPK